ncbi:MAG: aminotransferase class I/II-fold pyridoxal phosphate-dependent enzyme [Sandaracinaceae bacterium]|nr:aminotransferase class I/II-fold pyridoxal phosphate-dependent enzyme [Sandaracinaceae bacterium]
MQRAPGFDTLAVHAGDSPDPSTGALERPIVHASAYAFESAEDAAAQFRGVLGGDGRSGHIDRGHIYTRWSNPTVNALETKLAALEGAEASVVLASGMAAVTGAIEAFVASGDHVVAPRGLYAETARLLRERMPRFAVTTTFVNDVHVESYRRAITPRTRIVYAETPANPTLAITDLRALADMLRACEAEGVGHPSGMLLVVDGTFATPYHQRPLALGADLVLHSMTKALCGHGDAIGGVVSGRAELVTRLRADAVRTAGAVLSPPTAMLLSRGVRTLGLRMKQASGTALELARRLEADPRIARVHYPGLASHPHHALARTQMERGFGAMIAFEVAGGLEAGARAYDAVEVIARAVSLGDVRSLLTHPASTTSASMPREDRIAGGITDGLMRLSVGIEDVEDLWADLDRALA